MDKLIQQKIIQCVRKIAVHLGFIDTVGHLFFEETVNSKRYCSMPHDLFGLLEEDEITCSWFQQDGATAHTDLYISVYSFPLCYLII
jgi:hypothetical protein